MSSSRRRESTRTHMLTKHTRTRKHKRTLSDRRQVEREMLFGTSHDMDDDDPYTSDDRARLLAANDSLGRQTDAVCGLLCMNEWPLSAPIPDEVRAQQCFLFLGYVFFSRNLGARHGLKSCGARRQGWADGWTGGWVGRQRGLMGWWWG